MNLLSRLFARKPDPRDALHPLWHAVVAEARRPAWYFAGVEDSVAGRFDMICAALAVTLVRMEQSEPLVAPSVLLTELFVRDMDGQLRELGIGDPVVGKHMGKLVSAMGGRLGAYRDGLAGSDDALADAIRRNITLREDAEVEPLVRELRALAARLTATSDTALLAGEIAG